jgi:hypothetical protein
MAHIAEAATMKTSGPQIVRLVARKVGERKYDCTVVLSSGPRLNATLITEGCEPSLEFVNAHLEAYSDEWIEIL